MSNQEPPALQLKPIISYPREAQVGKTYLVSIDVQLATPNASWDFPEEEYTIGFILNTSPYFTCEPLHDVWPTVILHRYGGTYGPAEFLLTAANHEIERGQISITLVNGWGIPMTRLELPCEVSLETRVPEKHGELLLPSPHKIAKPFINFFTPQNRSEPDALFGLTLSSLSTTSMTSAAMQLRLINALWNSKITALEIRFVTTPELATTTYLLGRIRRPISVRTRQFQDFCVETIMEIIQIYKDCGYDQLQPLTSEKELKEAFDPFLIQALAEVRRHEAIELMEDSFAEYDLYVPYAWEWATREQIPFFALFTRLRSPGIVSIYLEPTKLYPIEQSHLLHATQMRNRLMSSGSALGEKIYRQYQTYQERLQQPYLLRICLAFPTRQTLASMGQELLEQIQDSAILQYPQNRQEWQAALGNLQHMEWLPWGNLSENTPGTARLRYLVDGQGASIVFHLPIAPDPIGRKIKVLLLFAESIEQPLNLGRDDRIIIDAILLSQYRDNISLTSCHAATFDDLRRALLNEEFQIVHITGHGAAKGLKLLDEIGNPVSVPPQALARLFQAYSATLQCVVLSGYGPLELGKHIASVVPFTIVMENELKDQISIEFLRGFYDALGAGKGIEFAYQTGCAHVNLISTTKISLPILLPPLQEEQEWINHIATMFMEAGWLVVDDSYTEKRSANGLAIRISSYGTGIDFLLLVNNEAVGLLIKESVYLSLPNLGDALSDRSEKSLFRSLPIQNVRDPLPFIYEMQGEEIHFTNNLEPEARSRTIFHFHRPETLALWLDQAPVGTPNDLNDLLRSRLRRMPTVSETNASANQIEAITKLEASLAQNRPRAMIQMANSAPMIIGSIYRLLQYGNAKHILYLVDNMDDTIKVLNEFRQYIIPDTNRHFTDAYGLYNFSFSYDTGDLLINGLPDPSHNIYVLSIENVYRLLYHPHSEAESSDDAASQIDTPIKYHSALPIDFFDVIFVVDCFDALLQQYRPLFDYFDAFFIGVGSDIPSRVETLFNRNLVYQDPTVIIQRIWNYCNLLRDDGVSYGDYLEQLTYLLYLKMSDERTKPPFNEPSRIPEGYNWQSLLGQSGLPLAEHYQEILNKLSGKKGMLGIIFYKAINRIHDPAKLGRLIVDLIEPQNWSNLDTNILGDAYEGLLEKNAEDQKSRGGQYFTQRPLIKSIVDAIHPELGMHIHDPASGTGGFLLAAQEYMIDHNQLTHQQTINLKNETFSGQEIVESIARLGNMNLLLHGIGDDNVLNPPIIVGNSLQYPHSETFDMVLCNPPLMHRAVESNSLKRPDFWVSTSNIQLNFLQHIFTLLKPYGRAAVVLTNNVLFVGKAGEKIRSNLLKQCDVHTLLRLPTGIFYDTGIDANVLFFDRMPASDKPWTKELWIYDYRTNHKFSLRTNPLKREHLEDFVRCYNPENRHDRKETKRFRKFSYDELMKRDNINLDISWQHDEIRVPVGAAVLMEMSRGVTQKDDIQAFHQVIEKHIVQVKRLSAFFREGSPIYADQCYQASDVMNDIASFLKDQANPIPLSESLISMTNTIMIQNIRHLLDQIDDLRSELHNFSSLLLSTRNSQHHVEIQKNIHKKLEQLLYNLELLEI